MTEAAKKRIGPWKRNATRVAYDNPWIRVREDQIIHPNGEPGIYGVVEFKNFAIGVVAIDEKDRIVLVGQYRYPLRRYSWEIPEGGGPKVNFSKGNEVSDGRKVAARELKEETGLRAKKWDYLGTFDLSNSATDEVGYIYLARQLSQGQAEPEGSEKLKLKWLPIHEAWKKCMDGGITDSVSIIAIARALHYLSKV